MIMCQGSFPPGCCQEGSTSLNIRYPVSESFNPHLIERTSVPGIVIAWICRRSKLRNWFPGCKCCCFPWPSISNHNLPHLRCFHLSKKFSNFCCFWLQKNTNRQVSFPFLCQDQAYGSNFGDEMCHSAPTVKFTRAKHMVQVLVSSKHQSDQ